MRLTQFKMLPSLVLEKNGKQQDANPSTRQKFSALLHNTDNFNKLLWFVKKLRQNFLCFLIKYSDRACQMYQIILAYSQAAAIWPGSAPSRASQPIRLRLSQSPLYLNSQPTLLRLNVYKTGLRWIISK